MPVCRVRRARTVVLSLFLFAIVTPAQEADLRLRAGPVYTSGDGVGGPKFPRVDVVLDLRGGTNGNQNVQASDLTLIEEGAATNKAVSVRSFEKCGYGLGAIVALDVSGSMKGAPLEAVRQSLYLYASEERPADKVAVLTIADESRWDVPPDSTPDQLRDRLQKIEVRGHLTRLYDGLLDALAGFTDVFPVRRELMVISDGHDEGSAHSEADVIREANRQGISIDAVGVTRSNPKYLKSLEDIASQTGGSYQRAHNNQELQNLITAGLSRMKTSPVATFEMSHVEADGHSHKIGVHWKSTAENVDLTAETTFTAPTAATSMKTWYWVAGGGALLAAAVLVIALSRRKRKLVRPAPVAVHQTAVTPISSAGASPAAPPVFDETADAVFGEQATRDPAGELPASAAKKTRVLRQFDGSAEDAPVAWIEGISGALEGKRLAVKGKEFWIGAAENNDLRIDDSTASGNHACILTENRVLVIADNNSTNGTRINDELLRGGRKSLNPGDVIQIGRARFRVGSYSASQAGRR